MSVEDEVLPVGEGSEENQDEQTADVPEQDAAAATEDSTAPPAESQEQPSEFDWSPYQGAERLKGRSVQEVINYMNERDYRYGEMANELGRLREIARGYEQVRQQLTGQKPPEKKKEFSDTEMAIFADQFNKNPMQALEEHFAPRIIDTLADQIYRKVSERLGPEMEGRAKDVATQSEYAQCVLNHPEVETDQRLRWMMHRLAGNDYVGPNLPFEDIYGLAKVAIEETSLFNVACSLMRKGLSFREAKEIAELKRNAPASSEQVREGIKKEVSSLRGGKKTPTKKQVTDEDKIDTMDDAFDIPAD